MTFPNFKTDDVELLKIKTKDDQLKQLQYKMSEMSDEIIRK